MVSPSAIYPQHSRQILCKLLSHSSIHYLLLVLDVSIEFIVKLFTVETNNNNHNETHLDGFHSFDGYAITTG